MRHYEVRLSPAAGRFHPFEQHIREVDGVTLSAIHKVSRCAEDLGLILCELIGTVDRVETLLPETFDSCYWMEQVNDRIFACMVLPLDDTLKELLRISDEHNIFLDLPMRYVRDGDIRVTYLATEAEFRKAMESVPDDITATLEAKQPFKPDENVFLSTLTPQQRRVFTAAIDLGYYGSPREATYEEIGREIGLAGGTVGEHLRKIEAKLVEFAVSEPITDSLERETFR